MESVSSPTDVVFQGCPLSLSTNETPENAGGYGRTDNPRYIWHHFEVLQNLFRLSQSSQSPQRAQETKKEWMYVNYG